MLGGSVPFDPAGALRGGRESGPKVGPAVHPAPRPRDEQRCAVARDDLRGRVAERAQALYTQGHPLGPLPAHLTSRLGVRLAGGKSPGPAGFSCRRGSTERRDSPPNPTWVGADFDVSIS